MVRIASRKSSVKQIGVMSKNGTVAPTTIGGIALGSGPSIGTTSTANNVAVVTPANYTHTNMGPSVNQISGITVVGSSGVRTIAPASTRSAEESNGSGSSSTNYKLSLASMLLAMKNQALGSLSLGGSKAGGSITENYSGINLG